MTPALPKPPWARRSSFAGRMESGHSGVKPPAGAAISEKQITLPVVCPSLAQRTETPHFTASAYQGTAWDGRQQWLSPRIYTPSLTPDGELGREYHPLYPDLVTTELAVHGAEHEFLTG